MQYVGKQNQHLTIIETDDTETLRASLVGFNGLILVWCLDGTVDLVADLEPYQLRANQLITLSDFNPIEISCNGVVRVVKFNKAFYCIIDHDAEVGCKGLLFFGSASLPILTLSAQNQSDLEALWRVFGMEMQAPDNLQEEMLQMLVKRLLIYCTRIYKQQLLPELAPANTELIRQYNFAVETHFRQQHAVSFYAGLMNKSPKTLSNLFAKAKQQSPQDIIQDRLHLEAIRQLRYTSKSIKEIAFDLGYEDLPAFSRFFRNRAGISPRDYRLQEKVEA